MDILSKRIKHSLKIWQIAQFCNVSTSTIHRWEIGSNSIPPDKIEKLETLFSDPSLAPVKPDYRRKGVVNISEDVKKPLKDVRYVRTMDFVPGTWLKKAYLRRGITRISLCETIGSSETAMIHWETGRSLMPVEMFLKILDHLSRYKILPSVEAKERAENERIERMRTNILVNKLNSFEKM